MNDIKRPIMRMVIASPADIKADLRQNKKPIIVVLLFLLGYIVVSGVVYSFVEHISFLRSFYFTVINVTTVGFGDVVPVTGWGKLFAGLNSFMGLIIFGVLVATLTMALQPREFTGDITPIEAAEAHTESGDEPLLDGLNKFFAGLGALVALKANREIDESSLREIGRNVRVGVTIHDHGQRFGSDHIHIDVSVRNDA
jgi:hypothetical protein